MWFFGNTRALGIIFLLVALLLLFDGIIMMTEAVDLTDIIPPDTPMSDSTAFATVAGAGIIFAALLYIVYAHRVMIGKLTGKINVLSQYVAVVGITTMVIIVSEGIGIYAAGGSYEDMETIARLGFAFAIILLLVAYRIGSGKRGDVKRFRWAVLVIAFVLMALESLTEAADYGQYAEHIAHLLLAIFMILFLIDDEVRRDMGFKVWRLEGIEEEEIE